MQTLITFDVNQVEISQFITKGKNLPIRDPQDFERLKQVRVYWTYENDVCIFNCSDQSDYKFLGSIYNLQGTGYDGVFGVLRRVQPHQP